MQRPPVGDSARRGGYANLMFQASALDSPDMYIKINEGSFWVNNQTFVEFTASVSPKFEAPLKGSKWCAVAIDKFGSVKIVNGVVAVANNPTPPELEKNMLPVCFVFLKSTTTAITNDMIFDARPIFNAGGYPIKHNQMQNREALDCHPISSITGLEAELATKISNETLNSKLQEKASYMGTSSSKFTLNMDETGVPVEYCGLYVERGVNINVGIRFNEDVDKWQYTNDGVEWHNLDNDKDRYDYATNDSAGMVILSTEPEDMTLPIVVGDNDERLAQIANKANKTDLLKYYTKEDVDSKLINKADINNVYTKYDCEEIFITRSEYNAESTIGYTKSQINSFLALKANASSVYNKIETNDLFYTKDEVAHLIETNTPNIDLSNYYTVKEINALFSQHMSYTKSEMDNKLLVINNNINSKVNVANLYDNIYNKAEVDLKIASINIPSVNLDNYYSRGETDLLLINKANTIHGHVANEITTDSTHLFVTEMDKNNWNNKQDNLGYIAENISSKGIANGYASLDENGKVPISQLPDNLTNNNLSVIEVVQTYIDLINIEQPSTTKIYMVKDASEDNSVETGWAQYIYSNNQWEKISEQESLDVIQDWANITNKPTTFIPDENYLTEYAKKSDLQNLLQNEFDNKADINHVHNNYITNEEFTNALSLKANINEINKINGYEVDINTIGHNKVLTFDEFEQKIIYKSLENNDYFRLGNYIVNELGVSEDSVLTYSNGSLVYKPIDNVSLPNGILEVDETNKAVGKVLALIDDNKWGYVSTSIAPEEIVIPDQIITYKFNDIEGRKILVKANKENAVTFEYNGNNEYHLVFAENTKVYTVQFETLENDLEGDSDYATMNIKIDLTDENAFLPTVTYWKHDGTRVQETVGVRLSDMENIHNINIAGMKKGFVHTVKITY